MKVRKLTTCLTVALLGGADVLAAQQVATGQQQTLTIRGFLSATMFLQDALFGPGNGQQALFVTEELDRWWHSGDVRNTRVALEFLGPVIADGWRPGATVELDFFAGFVGAAGFASGQPTPRLRVAYVDLARGGTRLRVGQDWSLTLGNIPVSIAHLGFPLGWGSGGFIAWRFPGIFLSHRLTEEGAATSVNLQAAVMRGTWNDAPQAGQPDAGEAGVPQLEGRLDLRGTFTDGTWHLYAVGHYDQKDLGGVRDTGPDTTLSSWALQAGGALRPGRLTLQANAYTGKAMGHHFAHILQFGDISGWGAWGQLGIAVSPSWSLWGYAGMDDPDDDDVRAAGASRLRSWLLAPMLRFQSGPYSFGLEWVHNRVDYALPAEVEERLGNQLLFSVRFDF